MPEDHSDDGAFSSVRTICARPGGGRVITMGFPGLDTDLRGQSWINPDLLDATLTEAAAAGMQLLLVHARADELPAEAMALLRQAAKARALRCLALPIEDYGVPGTAFLRGWRRLRPVFVQVFAAEHAVGMCCHHGAGRSGLVAAMHLVEAGKTPAEAVSMLRGQFAETVENEQQYRWVEHHARQLRTAG
ncbi:hypothetical protein GVY41_01025 [Frigidibacter albus]|uniref:Tyrosine specific protein phosphatases domain-containing protein n=1 Tax=Frigidibacter albus TaxID=1465486 RepID=A0A6L8VBP1_9RHOB|nr:hypothetical protein [Frigidibacter albus]MZQ87674.1 hypothetical protein [Frigidibacter albus]NBE29580.1 hypothetical protein [Frigidibacter albus]GGH44013.1 hypothetical protein GCM10011341_03020 [Frigidibacter albus]